MDKILIEKHPRVSVVMPVYNTKKYVAEAIESILNQTFTDFEFIIVDDGSTDGSLQICQEYAQKDGRIQIIINGDNLGIVQSLNKGIQFAKGNIIARMDGDDISLPERFEKQVKYLEAHLDVGMLGTAAEVIDSKGNKISTLQPPVTHGLIKWALCFENPLIHPSMLIRKNLFIAHNYSELFKHTEDYDLWVTLIFHTKAANLDDVLIKYRMHTKNISVTSNFEQKSNANKIQIRMINKILCYCLCLGSNDSVGFFQNANKNNTKEYIHLFAHLYDNFRHDLQISKIEFSLIKSDTINRVMNVIRKDIFSYNFLLGLMIMIKVDVFYTIKLIARVISMKSKNFLKSSSRS